MMASLSHDTQRYVDRYMRQVRAALSGYRTVDADDVVRDVRGHIDAELAAAGEPITIIHVQSVLDRLGSPTQWVPAEDVPAWRRVFARMRSGPEDWRLAYLAFALFVAAPFTIVFAPLVLLASFLIARATLTLLAEHDEPIGARRWLIYPPLLLIYSVFTIVVAIAPLMLLVVMSDDPSFNRFLSRIVAAPFEVNFAATIAVATGVWWMILGLVIRRLRDAMREIFRPFANRMEPHHATRLCLVGLAIAIMGLAVLTVLPRYF